MAGGRPLKFESAEILQQKIDEFFRLVEDGKKEPLIISLAVYLDCDKRTLLNYQKSDVYGETVLKAKERIEDLFSVKAHTGKYQPTIAKLTMTSHYDYVTERSEVVKQEKITDEDKLIMQEFINAVQSQTVSSGSAE